VRRELFGLTGSELGDGFDLTRLVNHGYLPRIYDSDRPQRLLDAYVSDYLREEIAAEALVRNMPSFGHFLTAAALGDTEATNFSNIARECGVSVPTVRGHYQILVDTLIGRWLPAYRKRPKRRVAVTPKFYFADVGVVNHLTRRGRMLPGSELFGKAFENWVFHELTAYNSYSESRAALSFWRLSSGIEVDFVVNEMEVVVEAKAVANVASHHMKGLREVALDHPEVGGRILVCLDTKSRRTSDGILILPAQEFSQRLAAREIF
jgi:predicted AAA+ superfamily ATPase